MTEPLQFGPTPDPIALTRPAPAPALLVRCGMCDTRVLCVGQG